MSTLQPDIKHEEPAETATDKLATRENTETTRSRLFEDVELIALENLPALKAEVERFLIYSLVRNKIDTALSSQLGISAQFLEKHVNPALLGIVKNKNFFPGLYLLGYSLPGIVFLIIEMLTSWPLTDRHLSLIEIMLLIDFAVLFPIGVIIKIHTKTDIAGPSKLDKSTQKIVDNFCKNLAALLQLKDRFQNGADPNISRPIEQKFGELMETAQILETRLLSNPKSGSPYRASGNQKTYEPAQIEEIGNRIKQLGAEIAKTDCFPKAPLPIAKPETVTT